MSLSRVSLGRISLVLRLMQQGVSLGGSAGANTQPLKALCLSTRSAGSVPLVGPWGQGREVGYLDLTALNAKNRKNRAHGRHSLLKALCRAA